MPEQDLHATQADHAKEVLDLVVPAGCEPAKVMEPSEKSHDSPTFGVTPQRRRSCVGVRVSTSSRGWSRSSALHAWPGL